MGWSWGEAEQGWCQRREWDGWCLCEERISLQRDRDQEEQSWCWPVVSLHRQQDGSAVPPGSCAGRGWGSDRQGRRRMVCVLALANTPSCGVFPLCWGLLNMELKILLTPESLLVGLGRNRWIQTDGEKGKQQGNTSSMMCAR